MKKTCIFWAGILLIIFIVCACDTPLGLPSSIKFKTEDFKINAPIRMGRFNAATLISEAVRNAFPEDFQVYDMVDYQNYQVFLIGYEMVVMESFNPDDYLVDIKNQMNTMDDFTPDNIDPITSGPIVIPSRTTPDLPINIPYQLDMTGFLEDMRNKINEHSTPPTNAMLSYTQGDSITPPTTTPFMIDGQYGDNFTSIDVDECEIELHISLQNADNNLTVNLNDITMIGAVITPFAVTLNSGNNYQTTATITINNQTISSSTPPQFQLGSITSTYDGGSTPTVNYTLVMKPHIESITLKGATNLKVGEGEAVIPAAIVNIVKLDPAPDMINAQIGEGKFWMTVESPHYISSGTSNAGLKIGHRIVMDQDPPDYVDPSECLDGEIGDDLADRWISGKALKIDPQSTIIIKANTDNGSSFTLTNGTYGNKVLSVQMNMGMKIDKLKKIRWKTNILPPIDPITIKFAEGHNPSVIKSVTLNKMNLNVDFSDPPLPPPITSGLPQEMDGKIALKISCPNSDFNYSKILTDGNNGFNAIPNGTTKKFNVDPVNHTVQFNINLLPVIDDGVIAEHSPYMEFGPVNMPGFGQSRTLNIYATVGSMDIDWSEAEVDIQAALKNSDRQDPIGTFPEKAEDAVDLSDLNKYMHGITFGDDIEARVFLGGPHKLIEAIQPKIDFYAQWEDENLGKQEEPLLIKHEFKIGDELPRLPGKNSRGEFVYSGLALPEPDRGMVLTDSFNKILTSFPRNLHFSYEMIFPHADSPLTVYHDTFNESIEEDAGKIKALLLILLPLEFKAAPGGYIALSDLFEEGEDLFGRKSPAEYSAFTGVNINKLSMKLDFDYSFLGGAHLHFDRNSLLFGTSGLPLGNNNSLKITFTGQQQKIINENLIYPDVRFVFPERSTLRIGRYAPPIRIVIEASGSYTLDIDDLGLGN